MKKIDLGQTVSTLANVGVIAGIVFLAVELRQNNELLQAQTSYNLRESMTEVAEAIYQSRDLASILQKRGAGEVLASVEEVQLKAFAERVLRGMSWRYQEAQAGRAEARAVDQLRSFFHTDDVYVSGGIKDYWSELKILFPPDFVAFFQENVVNRPPE